MCDQNFHKTITFNFYICQYMSTNGQFLNRVSGWMNDRTNTSTLTAVQLFFELLISFSYRYVPFQLIIVFVTFIEKKNIKKYKYKILRVTINFQYDHFRSIYLNNLSSCFRNYPLNWIVSFFVCARCCSNWVFNSIICIFHCAQILCSVHLV